MMTLAKNLLGKTLILLAAMCCVFISCKTGKGGKGLLPNISGKAGEVLVVAERPMWDDVLKSCVQGYLCADCPWLPFKEPLYDLATVTPSNFSHMFQIHRNIIVFNVNSAVTEPGVVYKYDKWAQPQIVVTINANSAEEARDLFDENSKTIIEAIEQKERDRIIVNTHTYQERKVAVAVEEFLGARMEFPSGYSIKKVDNNFMWISYETVKVQQGFFIYSYPADGTESQMSLDALVARRNKVLKEEVPGMVEGSYMTTGTFMPPTISYAKYKGRAFAQLRGLWEVEGDFMGGPFVSHSFYSPDGLNVVTIEAYVYAPSKNKRHYLRQVEALLYGFQWLEIEEPETQDQE